MFYPVSDDVEQTGGWCCVCSQDAGYRRWISVCIHLCSLEQQIRKAFSTAPDTFSLIICGTLCVPPGVVQPICSVPSTGDPCRGSQVTVRRILCIKLPLVPLVTVEVNQYFVLRFQSVGHSLGLCFEYEHTGNVCCRWFDEQHLVIKIHRCHVIQLPRWLSLGSISCLAFTTSGYLCCPLAILRWPIWCGNPVFGLKTGSLVDNYSG